MSTRRKREELEGKLVSDYVASVYPDDKVLIRCWIGPLPSEAYDVDPEKISPAMYEVLGKWADAIIVKDSYVVIIEGKLKVNATALGQLLVYNELFGQTEKFKDHWEKPKSLIAVYAIPDRQIIGIMRRYGIVTRQYSPDWAVRAYLDRTRRTYRR